MDIPTTSRRRFIANAILGSGALWVSGSSCLQRSSEGTAFGDITQLTLLEASKAIKSGALSPVEITKACLDRIAQLDGQINSFVTVTKELALSQAEKAGKAISQGNYLGHLHGIPIAIKDNIDTAGIRTTAASAAFRDRVPEKDALVVAHLKRAGAVMLGKLNLHEFAFGATSVFSEFGAVRNPWDTDRIAGGSSGGSAAAVAAGLCFGALGTDTGGSIRIPAAYCGVVGLNPSFGLIDVEGSIPLSISYDRIGPIARTVGDAAALFNTLNYGRREVNIDPQARPDVSKLRIGLLPMSRELCDTPPDGDVAPVFASALEVVRSLVNSVENSELPVPDLGMLVDYEAYRYHAHRLEQAPDQYKSETRKSLLVGKTITETEAERMRAELERYRLRITDAFKDFDLMILPTNQTEPLRINDASDPFAGSSCTFAFSVGGIPSMTVPCGFTSHGFPVGLQIAGPPRSEATIFALAEAYESRTLWYKRRPPLESPKA